MLKKKELVSKIKTIMKEEGLDKITSPYLSYILTELTASFSLSNNEKEAVWLYCFKEIDVEYTYSNNVNRIKSTARKWTKDEAEAHGYNYLNDNGSDKKEDVDVIGSDSDA